MLLLFIVVLLVAIVFTGLVRGYAVSNGVSGIAERHISSTLSVPRDGGLAIGLAFVTAIVMLLFMLPVNTDRLLALSSTLLVVVIGFCDGHGRPVSGGWRFIIYAFAAWLVMWFLHGFPLLLLPIPVDWVLKRWMVDLGWLGYPLGVLMLVGFLNLFSFLDDGAANIAVSESVFVSAALAGYLYFIDQFLFGAAMSLGAASLGFLLWNWPKTKILTGDIGSGFLGLLLGILILMAARQAAVLLYCGLILLGIFVVFSTYTLLCRFVREQKTHTDDYSLIYQRAVKQYGTFNVFLASWAINLFWLLPISLLVFLHPGHALLGLVMAFLPLLYLAHLALGGHKRGA